MRMQLLSYAKAVLQGEQGRDLLKVQETVHRPDTGPELAFTSQYPVSLFYETFFMRPFYEKMQ